MRTRQLTLLLSASVACSSLLAGTVSVTPAASAEAPGQNFTLSVRISGAADLFGYQFDLGFNPTVLQAVSVAEGPLLGTGGATIFLPGTINNLTGSITANADLLNGLVSGVNGDGDLLDVAFHALAPGSSSVQVFNLIALNSFGLGLTEAATGATVTVAPSSIPEPGVGTLSFLGMIALLAIRRTRPSRPPKLAARGIAVAHLHPAGSGDWHLLRVMPE